MGRISSGWKLRQRAPGHAYAVRFWLNGREHERSTGTADATAAAREASRIYADEVGREPHRKRPRTTAGLTLEEFVAAWLVALSSTHDPGTCVTWELYARTHWLPHFEALHHLTEGGALDYMRARLLVVRGSTVRKELSALRNFVRWLVETGALAHEVRIPGVPKRAIGVAFEKRRRAAPVEMSPEESEALIAALPTWSNSRKLKDDQGNSKQFPIRARFLVGYETGLRPSTLDALEAGVHYRKGSSTILVTPEIDKNRWARELPLSARAREALDAVCPKRGLIFGKHDYREHLAEAAAVSLPPERAEVFAGAHLRSAFITHRLEASGNLPGVQYLAGHKLATTTARYVKPSLRAALEVVRESDAATKKPASHGKRKHRTEAT